MIAPPPERLLRDRVASPLGDLLLTSDERGVLRALCFADEALGPHRMPRPKPLPGQSPSGGRDPCSVLEGLSSAQPGLQWPRGGTPAASPRCHDVPTHLIAAPGSGSIPVTNGPAPEAVRRALDAYFDGDLAALAEIPWCAAGTSFQQQVWTALTAIPAGATTTYGALAARIGRPRAVRAVGAANGANPIAIVVPCHRLIGADGTLTGYGGGLDRKRWLLAHEGVRLPEQRARA